MNKYILTKFDLKLINIQKELVITLLQFLFEKIVNSKKEFLTFEELEQFIKDDTFQRLEEANCSLNGSSHYLRILDSIFENENQNILDDNKLPSKELIKEIKHALKYMHSKTGFLKDEIEIWSNIV